MVTMRAKRRPKGRRGLSTWKARRSLHRSSRNASNKQEPEQIESKKQYEKKSENEKIVNALKNAIDKTWELNSCGGDYKILRAKIEAIIDMS